MSDLKPWQRSDVEVSDALVRALLRAQAPHLGEATYLHEGWDSRAFLVGGEWIVRFPKRAASARRLGNEIALLPVLQPRLAPVAIPRFEVLGQPGPGYPYPFVGYRRLPGQPLLDRPEHAPLDVLALAPQLGRACAALHRFPTADAAAAGVAPSGWYADLRALASSARERLRAVATEVPEVAARIAAVLDQVPAAYAGPLVLCHADLAPEHLLVDEAGGRLLGIIDFGDLLLGDPAIDLAGALLLGGGAALEAALAAYALPVDPDLPARARIMAASRVADDLLYGIQDQRPLYLRAALRAARLL